MAYIPKKHKKYNLLPFCAEQGGEVFCYPSELIERINSLIPTNDSITPYGFFSYKEYFSHLDTIAGKFQTTNTELYKLILQLRKQIKDLNSKENWTVARYIGDSTKEYYGLTNGLCYYLPCSKSNPKFLGVIDNEEFTAYHYNIDPNKWEILDDPNHLFKSLTAI